MMNTRVLFVEDEDSVRSMLLRAATSEGYTAVGVSSAEAAIERLSTETFDIIVTDITLPGMSGLDLLLQLSRLSPGIIPIAITAYGTIEIAVEAMKRGARDFLTKPFTVDNLSSVMLVATERVLARRRLSVNPNDSQDAIIGTSPAMRKLLNDVSTIAPYNTTVLITGETGTGKELIARSIHQQSPRRDQPLVSLNCAAIPEDLLEDELFGHVKGAFTGAQSAREGRFEQASGGTLFLDEIGEMSFTLQAKLLRVLQEREFEKLGSSQTVKVDVRIISATSADLEAQIEEGTFRRDLFYRLNTVCLSVPPLRERLDDVRPIAKHLVARFSSTLGLPVKSIDEDALRTLSSYYWPGNVRQLQNAIERAVAFSGAESIIRMQDFPDEVARGTAPDVSASLPAPTVPLPRRLLSDETLNLNGAVTKVERDLLVESLNKAGGNKTRAARLLNIKRTTLIEKLRRLKIDTYSVIDDKDQSPSVQELNAR